MSLFFIIHSRLVGLNNDWPATICPPTRTEQWGVKRERTPHRLQHNTDIVFTWFVILRCAELQRSLGALQSHLSPVCDSLQLHGVTAVVLKPLQICPALSLWRQQREKNILVGMGSPPHSYLSPPSLPQSWSFAQSPGPTQGCWESLTY